jgi:hypothetical protein
MTITLRIPKGSELTHAELDGNFTDLAGQAAAAASAAATAQSTANGKADSSHSHSFSALTGTAESNTNLNASLHVNAYYLVANAMGALVIDTAKASNTKTVAADSTLAFSGVPAAANTYFGLVLTNSSGTDLTIIIPSSRSVAQQAAITTFVLPANAVLELVWRYDGAVYHLSGEPVRQTFQFSWAFIGTTTARDYPVILKTKRPFVITELVSKCASGTATATGKIDGVALGGSANAVSSTEAAQAHATANVAALNTDFAIGFTAGAVDPQVSGSGYYQ